MNGFTAFLAAVAILAVIEWFAGGWHLKHRPTADELYGCTYAQSDPATGECR